MDELWVWAVVKGDLGVVFDKGYRVYELWSTEDEAEQHAQALNDANQTYRFGVVGWVVKHGNAD